MAGGRTSARRTSPVWLPCIGIPTGGNMPRRPCSTIVAGHRTRTAGLLKVDGKWVPKNKENQCVAARNYCVRFATFVGRTCRLLPLWDRPPAAVHWFQGGEVHGVGNRALHALERTSHCPGDSLFGHGAGRPGIVRDGGCSFSRQCPGQGTGEVEAETSGQGRSRGRSDGQRRQSAQCQMAAG